MQKIDAHIHYSGDHSDCYHLLERLDLKLINVCVAQDSAGAWRDQAEVYMDLQAAAPQHYAWCTSFDLPRFDDPDYVDRVIAGIEGDVAAGAIACKIWKNIGMEVRKPDGSFLLLDDPLFDPIYEYLAREGITLLLHTAEPLACWQPLTEDNPHYGYYSRHPEWHMYNKPEFLSHQALMEARDRMLAKHPKLRVVGAHLASLEYDVAVLAERLDRYPNLAVDTSARLVDLVYQETPLVRRFFLDYADRILFGTDMVYRQRASTMSAAERAEMLTQTEARYQEAFAYYETDRQLTIRGRSVRGLALPPQVLEKFYRENALNWYPGL